MKTLLAAVIVFAAGCKSTGERAPTAAPHSGYVVLDESADFWIVKVWKRSGSGSVDAAAHALRGATSASEPEPRPEPEGPDTGRASGKIVRGGAGVAGCKVKLTPMHRNLGVLQWEESLGAEPSAITDTAGTFEIRGVTAGAYRLKFLLPGSTHWLKKLKEQPDVIVEAGKAIVVGDVDVSRRSR